MKQKGSKKSGHAPAKTTEIKGSKALALHFMKTLTEVARESFIILDSDRRVVSANPIFYRTFHVSERQTENKIFFTLGNGQWNIPELRTLLKNILPKKKVVKDFEVRHTFPTIGGKTILLNARQIDSVKLIIVAMEDITPRKQLEGKLAEYAKGLAKKVAEQTGKLTDRIKELQSLNNSMVGRELRMVELKGEIAKLKAGIRNGKGKQTETETKARR
jgi:hypothetical protein